MQFRDKLKLIYVQSTLTNGAHTVSNFYLTQKWKASKTEQILLKSYKSPQQNYLKIRFHENLLLAIAQNDDDCLSLYSCLSRLLSFWYSLAVERMWRITKIVYNLACLLMHESAKGNWNWCIVKFQYKLVLFIIRMWKAFLQQFKWSEIV